MQLRVRAAPLALSADTREAIERNLRLALGRHVGGIDTVRVSLSTDPSLPTSRCRVRVRLRDGERLDVEEQAADPQGAAAAAAWRIEHRVRRHHAVRVRGEGTHGRRPTLQRRFR